MHGWRVLFVFPSLELGGAERQGLHLARHLKEIGCEVSIWSTLAGRGRVIEECEAAVIPWATHRFLWPCRKSSLVRDSWRLIRALRRERPHVILSYTTSPNVGCGLAWRFSSAKACIWGQRSVNDLRGDAVERLAYHRVSGVICNAGHEVEYLRRTLGKTAAPMHVLHNGLAPAPAERSRQGWRMRLGIPENAVVGVMLANFRPEKDHVTLLRAWARVMYLVSDVESCHRLVLAGAPQFTHEEVKRLAGELGVRDTVCLPGQVKDVTGLLGACDIGVLTSHHEGLSNAIIEYMASGLPVIATDLPGNREALGDDAGQPFCKPGDADDLAARLQALLCDAGLRRELGARNRQRASQEFSIARMCEETTAIIAGLLDGHQREGTPCT